MKSASFTAAARTVAELPPPAIAEVAFAGRSNVGKSSLMNSLMERRNLVRTSSTPGCTRGVSLFDVRTADDAAIVLADLPGYGYAKRSKGERKEWADLVEGYLLGRATLAAVVLLVDVRRGLEADDLDLLEMLAGPARIPRRPLTTIVVATKLDKLPASQQKPALARVAREAGLRVIGYSAKTGAGREELWRAIRHAVGFDGATVPVRDAAALEATAVTPPSRPTSPRPVPRRSPRPSRKSPSGKRSPR